MKKKIHEDIIICLVVYAFCAFMFITGQSMHFEDSKYFPFICVGVMCVLNTVLLIHTLRFSRAATAEEMEKANMIKWNEIRFPLLIWLVLLAYVVIYDFFGFYVSTVVLSVALLWLLKARNWKLLVFLPVGLVAGVYVLFEIILKVPL